MKYKKHRRGPKNGHVSQEQQQQLALPSNQRFNTALNTAHQDWANGQILKTALTNPADVIHLRHRTENCVSSSRQENRMTPEQAAVMIQQLVDCEAFEDVAKLKNAKELLQCKMELNDKLCHIGDSIVYKLVQWTKRLPFYHELPVAIHTQVVMLQCFFLVREMVVCVKNKCFEINL